CLQPFAPHLGFKIRETGDVASRMRETFDKTPTDWVRNLQKHDRLAASRVADRLERGVGHRKDEIRPRRARFFRVAAHALSVTVREAIIDLDIASDGPSDRLQPLAQCHRTGLRFSIIRNSHQHDNPPHPLALLRAHRERPCGRAAYERDELAPVHSITSSARSRNGSGIVSPSAFAVVRLMMRANFVGCSTGMSPGFAPRRILSTNSAARRYRSGMLGPKDIRPPASTYSRPPCMVG